MNIRNHLPYFWLSLRNYKINNNTRDKYGVWSCINMWKFSLTPKRYKYILYIKLLWAKCERKNPTSRHMRFFYSRPNSVLDFILRFYSSASLLFLCSSYITSDFQPEPVYLLDFCSRILPIAFLCTKYICTGNAQCTHIFNSPNEFY